MKIFQQKELLTRYISSQKSEGLKIGLVPTMGALHAGHQSLVKRALEETDLVVVSIFVNPTQFNNKTDLEKYPRTLEKDVAMLHQLNPDIVIFNPDVHDIYGDDVSSVKFDFDGLENEMEGKFRKGHFDGVGTIVKQLFEIVMPDRAYFGEKDYQQLLIITKMVDTLKMPVQVIGCPILREANGLAMSSRNERLTPETREKAGFIFETLNQAKTKFGTESADTVTRWVTEQFEKSNEFNLEYFIIADASTLKTVKTHQNKNQTRAFIAVYANEVRLIDNIALN